MVYAKALQPAFLFAEATRFPSTRYQGSKAKLADWIWGQVADLNFETCLDAFGGTGSVAYRLIQGRGPFAQLGEAVFDDYWMNYLTEDMARAIDSTVPYRNLKDYAKWRNPDPKMRMQS